MPMLGTSRPPIIQPLEVPSASHQGVQVYIKRDDLLDPVVSGNKLYKLKYNLEYAMDNGFDTIGTFGGAYSNHLHATAYAAKQCDLKTVAVIRGEQLLPLNPTIKDCVRWGMTIHPVSRIQYKAKASSDFVAGLKQIYPNTYWIPEGGANQLGVKGAQEILDETEHYDFDVIVSACGTGTTLAGIINSAKSSQLVIGIPVLKGASWMHQEVESWLINAGRAKWELWLDGHFGGYGKRSSEIDAFIKQMAENHQLPLDKVYTAKALYLLIKKIDDGVFPAGSKILFCHTGGLQGMRET